MKFCRWLHARYKLNECGRVFYGQLMLWAILVASFFAFDNLSLRGMYEGDKHSTVSVVGALLPDGLVASEGLFEFAKWIYFVGAALWFFNKLVPYSSWACTLGFTMVMGLYFENVYFSDHQGIMINMLMIIFCVWYHFYGAKIREAIGEKRYWSASLFPNWVYFLSVAYIGSYYTLSGLSKVLGSGFGWADGVTLQIIIHKSDAALSAFPTRLLMEHVALAQALQIFTLALELSFILIVVSKRFRMVAAAAICGFHVANSMLFPTVDFGLNAAVVLMICVVYPTSNYAIWPWNWNEKKDEAVPVSSLVAQKSEMRFVGGMVVAFFLLPLAFVELHPFSLLPMYNYRLDHYVSYKVDAPDGESLSRTRLGLQRESTGANWVRRKRGRLKPSVNIIGKDPPPFEEVQAHVAKRMRVVYPEHEYVDLWIRVYGQREDKTIGKVREEGVRIRPLR